MRPLSFTVSQDVLDLGLKIVTARISGLVNTEESEDLEAYKETELEKVKAQFADKKYKDDPVLEGFRTLHTKVGRSNRDYVASPEGLRWLFLERGRFPQINKLVDIYNLVSLRTGLALGAHNIERIKGNVTLRLTEGDETFIPLGKETPESVFPGEYGYVDDENNIICRLEVLQVEPTKVTAEATDVFMIIQGNGNTTEEYVRSGATEVCELVTKYCGGEHTFLN